MADTVYGWVTMAEADAYMATRMGAEDVWVSGARKEAAMVTAYNDIRMSGRFALPEEATIDMKLAQYEQALLRLTDDGLDARMNLQAQGVVQAGIVKETYKGSVRMPGKGGVEVPLSPFVHKLLACYATSTNAFVIDLQRDETAGDSATRRKVTNNA